MQQKKRNAVAKKMNRARRFSQKRGWIAMGALAAYAALANSRPALAAAGKTDPAGGGLPAATLPLKRFDIPAGPLDEAIAAYEKATGLKVRNILPAGTLAGFRSAGLVGLYREDEALYLLLDGTGLNYRVEDATTMVVGVQARDTVSVTASVDNSISLDKFTRAAASTRRRASPSCHSSSCRIRAVSTLRDSLRNVPGISLAAGEAGAQGDNLTIRGFTARNDIFLDGIRDFGSYYRDSFNYEQVEVLEGPAGVQFGRGSTGGVINQESKVPAVEKFVNVQTQFGTDLTRRMTADINSPCPTTLGGTAFRLNVHGPEARRGRARRG